MSVAAYNRGTRVIRQEIARGDKSLDVRLFEDLLAVALRSDGRMPFGPTVIRFGPGRGEVSIMSRQDGGWAEQAYTYRSLWRLVREWRVVITGYGEDRYGEFLQCAPIPAQAAVSGGL